MDGATGGASALDMLQHARRAIDGGDATTILLVAGDVLDKSFFGRLVDEFNVATRDYLAPLPAGGPNALFAMLTRRHMHRHGLPREAYGRLVVAQRARARLNPNAAYRTPLSLTDYLRAPVVADPLCRFDCVPVVSGAAAIVLTSSPRTDRGVRIRAVVANHEGVDDDNDVTIETGLVACAARLWEAAGVGPGDMDVCSVYDDYPVMVLEQLQDLGFAGEVGVEGLVARIADGVLPVNTGGGQLSAGQAGAGGGMLVLVEAVRQLLGAGGAAQVDADLALVTGYGMVTYRSGSSANAAVLERA
jgi:acetyl-CoA acetyltransferase